MEEFIGRVGVVIGVVSGIGCLIVQKFVEEGMKVVLVDIEEFVLNQVVVELRDVGYDIIGVLIDVFDWKVI